MADPGTVVGIVSLAIQVLQGLSAYYAQFKSFDDDIATSIKRIERLQTTLPLLHQPLAKLDAKGYRILEQVRDSIEDCSDAIKKLQDLVWKCGDVHAPKGLQDRLKLAKNKALFPFRKGTLEELHKYLDRFQANLEIIVQALQLDTMIRFEERAEEQSAELIDRTEQIQRQQSFHTALLVGIGEASVAQTLQNSYDALRIEAGIEQLSSQLQASLNLQQHVAHQLSLLEPRSMQTRSKAFPPPSTIENWLALYSESVSRSRRSLIRSGDKYQNLFCTCRAGTETSKEDSSTTLTMYRSNTRNHEPSCPCYTRRRQLKESKRTIAFCRRILGYLVEASLTSTRGAGGMSISASLRLRYVVQFLSDHPVFNILNESIDPYQLRSRGFVKYRSPEGPGNFLGNVKRIIEDHFRKGSASPKDEVEGGWTLLQAAINLIISEDIYMTHTAEQLHDFIRFFVDAGVPVESHGGFLGHAFGPLNVLISYPWVGNAEGQIRLCNYLAESGGSWYFDWRLPDLCHWGFPNVHDWIPEVSSFASVREAYDGDPIDLAILYKSLPSLDRLLHESGIENVNTSSLLQKCGDWPEGLSLVLDAGQNDITDEDRQNALEHAYRCRNLESADLLLDTGVRITNAIWEHTVHLGHAFERHMIDHMLSVIDYRATHMNPGDSKTLSLQDLYHASHLSVDTSERLYQEGFHDIDSQPHSQENEYHCYHWGPESLINEYVEPEFFGMSTPLWKRSVELVLDMDYFFKDIMIVARWFVDKGARTDWIHPSLGASPAHMISASAIRYFFLESRLTNDRVYWPMIDNIASHGTLKAFPENDELSAFYLSIVSSTHHDGCDCACSTDGCSVVSSAFKFSALKSLLLSDSRRFDTDIPDSYIMSAWGLVRGAILEFAEPVLATQPEQAISVIRVLTFEKLGIRHTCHDSLFSYNIRFPFSDEYVAKIKDEDGDLIAQLGELMTEFEQEYSKHEGAFKAFIDGYWSLRMAEVMAEMEKVTDEQLKAIEDLGVILERDVKPVHPQKYVQ